MPMQMHVLKQGGLHMQVHVLLVCTCNACQAKGVSNQWQLLA
jgi:hypothetical protein